MYNELFIYTIIALALLFDFLNGFHDAANSIATVVATRVLSPKWAVIWAAFFNLIAVLFFKLSVAETLGRGIIDPSAITPTLICAALVGAIVWNLLTWYFGLPSSSSHALIGGLVGAGLVRSGWHVLEVAGLVKVVVSIVISPLVGLLMGLTLMFLMVKIFFYARPTLITKLFRRLQFLSSSLISLGHGSNDAQKTMGIITALLLASGEIDHFEVPLWVIVSCSGVMALGTLCGGWRIVETMGMRITKLKPIHGFCAETGAACTLFLANTLGIPVSTTHTVTGSIIGVGSLRRLSAVRWGVTRKILMAWFITLPASALVAGALAHILGG